MQGSSCTAVVDNRSRSPADDFRGFHINIFGHFLLFIGVIFFEFLFAFIFSEISRACARHTRKSSLVPASPWPKRALARTSVWAVEWRETTGFVSNRLELVVEEGRSKGRRNGCA